MPSRNVTTIARLSIRSDRRSKERDVKTRREIIPDVSLVDKEEIKANRTRHTIVKIKDISRVPFAQVITENMQHLIQINYLTTAEKGFLMSLSTIMEFGSNALVITRQKDLPEILATVTDISRTLKQSLPQTRRLVSALLQKGILYEMVDAQMIKEYGHAVTERLLIVNPEIMVRADKNRVNNLLLRICLSNDGLERKGIKLPFKLWYTKDRKNGRLYTRKSWLKQVKESCTSIFTIS